ncbi:response regulator transcription factor [Actinoplanes sp. OR16]|uniref:response regulator transcription factor n=1 Tax=Actinoplanes sp. OR16 TaxID=946334 RepID=UPI001E50EDBE|nr:response regulator transcription factor [Actinoplanes sp. OR16]
MNLLRGALAATLSLEEDFAVVAALGCLAEAPATARAMPLDVAIVNVELLGGEGVRLFGEFTAEQPGCVTLGLAGTEAPASLRRALDVRVHGVVSTRVAPGELVRGVRRLKRGERVIDAGLAVALVAAPPSPLSERELDVLSVAASGVPSAEVAARLHLTAGTVRNYLSVILRKTGARNRLEAVRVAEDAGWIRQRA